MFGVQPLRKRDQIVVQEDYTSQYKFCTVCTIQTTAYSKQNKMQTALQFHYNQLI